MAQEVDTLGKDSELASTLAQGKPVIAYVRSVKAKEEIDKLNKRPLRYFRQRLLNLLADAFFERTDNRQKVIRCAQEVGLTISDSEIREKVKSYLDLVDSFESQRMFRLFGSEERTFVDKHRDQINSLVKFLSSVEVVAADNRAATIKSKHPLAMQVHLERGVANGVLVARTPKECAHLVKGIITRDLNFKIAPVYSTDKKRLGTGLMEWETDSRYRYVTENDCLTNSFWNFYLS
jgi:hypothetical protein